MSNQLARISPAFSGVAGAVLAAASVLSCGQSADQGTGTSQLPRAHDEAAPAEDVPGPAIVPGQPSPAATASAEDVCDGSANIRVAHFSKRGYAEGDPYWFGENYGPSFLAIDGTCRIWTAMSNSGEVFTGVLPGAVAQEFASAIGFGHQASWPAINGGCEVGATPDMSLWTEAGATSCCDCSKDIGEATEWGVAMSTLFNERLNGTMLGEYLELVAGPARLALVPKASEFPDEQPDLWPLSRVPADTEWLPADGAQGATWLASDWGARLTDANELTLLRAIRYNRHNQEVWQFTPILWTPPGSSEAEPLQMVLQDEIPDAVARAVGMARQPSEL